MFDQALTKVLAHLSPREQDVVRLRFGLADGTIPTLEQASEEFGVTPQRVRQIESKILAMLRRPDNEIPLVKLIAADGTQLLGSTQRGQIHSGTPFRPARHGLRCLASTP